MSGATRGAAPSAGGVIPKLFVAGHSIAAGLVNFSAQDRPTSKLARALGATETNQAASGSALLSGNQTVGKITGSGCWPAIPQGTNPGKRARAPYLSPLAVAYLMWGINDIGQWGPVNTGFLNAWNHALLAMIYRLRCGWIIEDNDAAVTYGGTWSLQTQTIYNSGSTIHSTQTAGSTASITLPADFDGQSLLAFGVCFGGSAAQQSKSTWTLTNGGTTLATLDTTSITAGLTVSVPIPFYIRVPAGTAGLTPGATITLTMTGVNATGFAMFDCFGIEANPAPLVVIGDTLRPSAGGYAGFTSSGWPYTPTDADVNALNAANRAIAAGFTDGMVITDGLDAVLNAQGAWLATSTGGLGVHPDERNGAKMVIAAKNLILSRSALFANLGLLDTP